MEAMGMAYRKAKVDLYYCTDPDLIRLLQYEEDLHSNLKRLRKNIRGTDKAFKPVPDGFKIAYDRIVLPKEKPNENK